MPRYKVLVDDNFHYMDLDARREQGTYETVQDALAVCRGIVDHYLAEKYAPGVSANALYDDYVCFGEDPFIVVLDGVDDPRQILGLELREGALPRDVRGALGGAERDHRR